MKKNFTYDEEITKKCHNFYYISTTEIMEVQVSARYLCRTNCCPFKDRIWLDILNFLPIKIHLHPQYNKVRFSSQCLINIFHNIISFFTCTQLVLLSTYYWINRNHNKLGSDVLFSRSIITIRN